MKRDVLLAIAAGVLLSSASYAEYPEANLQYMGYGEDMTDVVDDEIGCTNFKDAVAVESEDCNCEEKEADAVVEQLKELGVSRSITVNDKDRSTEIKQKNADFWARFNARDDEAKPVVISEETKALLKANITKALTEKGYKVKKLELYPLEDNVSKYALRGVIRAYKPLKKKNNSYNEIQSILVEMKKICMEAAVIDGKCMLSELTTFDAEDSKNKLHYTKTLL